MITPRILIDYFGIETEDQPKDLLMPKHRLNADYILGNITISKYYLITLLINSLKRE